VGEKFLAAEKKRKQAKKQRRKKERVARSKKPALEDWQKSAELITLEELSKSVYGFDGFELRCNGQRGRLLFIDLTGATVILEGEYKNLWLSVNTPIYMLTPPPRKRKTKRA
jgi:hypothetical protein